MFFYTKFCAIIRVVLKIAVPVFVAAGFYDVDLAKVSVFYPVGGIRPFAQVFASPTAVQACDVWAVYVFFAEFSSAPHFKQFL
jgi:hypothetical protein